MLVSVRETLKDVNSFRIRDEFDDKHANMYRDIFMGVSSTIYVVSIEKG